MAKLAAKVKLPNVDDQDGKVIQIVQAKEESNILWQAIKVYNGEGMVAKKKTSKWLDNTRSSHWLKIKNWRYVTVIVTQYDHSNGYFQGSIYDGGNLREVVTFKHGMKEEEHQTLVAFFSGSRAT
ncbi:hypothetical protein OL548_23290 [Lysinibacillus sp. MHQ-1]|nr:hypothetical protein OL548_23290 [Lysinibacillus sp. MHQ-1]